MRIITNTYFNSHGKAPRGFGGWMFQLESGGIDFKQFYFNGSFSDAKKAAVKDARENGATAVRVLP